MDTPAPVLDLSLVLAQYEFEGQTITAEEAEAMRQTVRAIRREQEPLEPDP